MSDDLHDHIAALLLHAIKAGDGSFSGFSEELSELLLQRYGLAAGQTAISGSLNCLVDLEICEVYPSTLAGEMLRISPQGLGQYFGPDARQPSESTSVEYDQRFERAQESYKALKAYYFGGQKWIDRVVDRLASGSVDEVEVVAPDALGVKAPAADRIVTIHDNQRGQMLEVAEELSESLNKENAVGGDIQVRDRFLAQISAGKELLRAGSVRAYLLYETLVRMLGILIERYHDQTIGHAAKKLLDLLIDHIFGK